MKAIADMILRAVLSVLFSLAAIALLFIFGILSGISFGGPEVVAFLVFLSVGWASLPGVRYSRVIAILVAIGWSWLGYWCVEFGTYQDKGVLFAPWVGATLLILYFLGTTRPVYLPSNKVAQESHPTGQESPCELDKNRHRPRRDPSDDA